MKRKASSEFVFSKTARLASRSVRGAKVVPGLVMPSNAATAADALEALAFALDIDEYADEVTQGHLLRVLPILRGIENTARQCCDDPEYRGFD